MVYDIFMKALLLAVSVFLIGCSIEFPFSYEFISEAVTLPSLSAESGYEEMDVTIPTNLGIPFDDIRMAEVLVRIEGQNNSEVTSNAELVLVQGNKTETFFKGSILPGQSAATNAVSYFLADGINKKNFRFKIRAKNDQGDIDWKQFQNDPRFQDLLNKYADTVSGLDDIVNHPEIVNEAMNLIDLKITVKLSLIFKGFYIINSESLSKLTQLSAEAK